MQVGVEPAELIEASESDALVETLWSGISTGTEKLFWNGTMPPFPGMAYPMVPGYESVGRVAEAGKGSGLRQGDLVFVPGARCFKNLASLFGATASKLVVDGKRAIKLPETMGEEAVLLALAATANHAIDRNGEQPDLIIGHGVLGRLMARLTMAKGFAPPAVWEIDESRRKGATGYNVSDAEDDSRKDYAAVIDASGSLEALDAAIAHMQPGGSLTLAGFYRDRLSFNFPPAFMRELNFQISAEFKADDIATVLGLIEKGSLDLSDLISHRTAAADAAHAYATAFNDPHCTKMILDWSAIA